MSEVCVDPDINALKVKHKIERVFVVIDHLQVFSIEGYKDQIDKEGKLINGFKEVSEQTGAVILLISQTNKAGQEGKQGLGAIKGSVDIVYLADVVMFLQSKDDVEADLNKDNKGYQFSESGEVSQIYLNIVKNRYNAPKQIQFEFNGAYSQFKEAEKPF